MTLSGCITTLSSGISVSVTYALLAGQLKLIFHKSLNVQLRNNKHTDNLSAVAAVSLGLFNNNKQQNQQRIPTNSRKAHASFRPDIFINLSVPSVLFFVFDIFFYKGKKGYSEGLIKAQTNVW